LVKTPSPGTDKTDGWADRANIQTAEFVRNGLVKKNYSVERIYAEKITPYISKSSWDPAFDITPRRYYSGTYLPSDIGASSSFGWSGQPTDITNAFNNKRFLILKRGHGSWDGWKNPRFSLDVEGDLTGLGDLYYLANGDYLPVLFGMACELGFFDNETSSGKPFFPSSKLGSGWSGSITYPNDQSEVYFSEQLIRMKDAGVIALIGASRMSPGVPNNALTRGLFDAIWPDMDPAKNTNDKPIRRLGDILNSAKVYMLSQVGTAQPKGDSDYTKFAIDNLYLYNLIGDPTLTIWTSKPYYLHPQYKKYFSPDSVLIEYDVNGAQITALQEKQSDTVPIGRATVRDGEATIDYINEPEPDIPIFLSASIQNAVSRALQPEAITLEDEDSFSESATRITFDEEARSLNEHINNQYEGLGVLFLDDGFTTPLIIDDSQRGGTTHSGVFSLANDADTLDPGSAGVPLTITFLNPIQRVGMYIGNGQETIQAALTAYDEFGIPVFTVTRTDFLNNVETFIGIDAGMTIIKELKLDYGDTSASEEIDDLLFE
jgi:hypothetical protein